MKTPMDHSDVNAGGRLTDRRERRPVQLDAFVTLSDGETIDLIVLDLTYDGCCVATPVKLLPGQTIRLSVLRSGAISAEVRWCKDGKAGLAFDPITDEDDEKKPRAAERILVDAKVLMRKQSHQNHRVRVFDVSSQGCKAEFVERPRSGDHFWIKFDGLEALDAEVCWTEGFLGGLKYVKPIHPAVFDLLARHLTGTT